MLTLFFGIRPPSGIRRCGSATRVRAAGTRRWRACRCRTCAPWTCRSCLAIAPGCAARRRITRTCTHPLTGTLPCTCTKPDCCCNAMVHYSTPIRSVSTEPCLRTRMPSPRLSLRILTTNLKLRCPISDLARLALRDPKTCASLVPGGTGGPARRVPQPATACWTAAQRWSRCSSTSNR